MANIDISGRRLSSFGEEKTLQNLWTLKMGFATGLCNGRKEVAYAYGIIYNHAIELGKRREKQFIRKEKSNLEKLLPKQGSMIDVCSMYILSRDRIEYFLTSEMAIGKYYGIYNFPKVQKLLEETDYQIHLAAMKAERRKEI